MTWPIYSRELRRDMDALLKKGGSLSAYRANKRFGLGPVEGSWADRLEKEIQKRFKVKHAVACNSGTAALHMALEGVGVRGGEVVTTPYSFSATASAILLAGATPVFADVDPFSFCISKETVGKHVTKKTKAILPVNLFGGIADIRGLQEFGLPVIEDACQSVGACRDGRYAGTLGEAAAYSFNGSKNCPAGESGCMVTDNDDIAERVRLLGNHGENFDDQRVGLNYRINEQTALIAYHGLLALEERNRKRIKLVDALLDAVVGEDWFWQDDNTHPLGDSQRLYLGGAQDNEHVFYVYPFVLNDKRIKRDLFIKRMKKRGITVGAGYINPTLEKYEAFKKYCKKPLPVVTELSEKTLCLLYDMHSEQPLSYARKVAKAMRESLT